MHSLPPFFHRNSRVFHRFALFLSLLSAAFPQIPTSLSTEQPNISTALPENPLELGWLSTAAPQLSTDFGPVIHSFRAVIHNPGALFELKIDRYQQLLPGLSTETSCFSPASAQIRQFVPSFIPAFPRSFPQFPQGYPQFFASYPQPRKHRTGKIEVREAGRFFGILKPAFDLPEMILSHEADYPDSLF